MRKLTFVLITLLSVMVYAEKYGVAAIKAISSESSLFSYGMALQAVSAGSPASQLVLVLIAVALIAALLVASLVTAAAVFADRRSDGGDDGRRTRGVEIGLAEAIGAGR